MATLSHAQAVKSLNKSPGRRRFVFKNFSQRLEEIDINVFRSLDKVKAEPSEGSSFFRDCLVDWRESNTAEDFISFYEEIMPFVQTLPLLLLHKELIYSKLHSRLQMKARLSLEPILGLVAALSRDLLRDFIDFLPRLVDGLVSLLDGGGNKEPEIIEQIFMSWSYIMMYLQKYLIQDIVSVLKVTMKLRYYPKDYVQEFMAEAMSFLLRNAHSSGIKTIMLEVVREPFPTRKSGVSALLYYVMRGTSTSFHSRAESVLSSLLDNSTFAIGDKFEQGSDTIVEVLITALQRLCLPLESKELNLIWVCLYQKINNYATNENLLHLSHLLSLLLALVKIDKGSRVSDYQQMLGHVDFLVQTFLAPYGTVEGDDHMSQVIDKILQLMLCILDGVQSSNNLNMISVCSLQWAPALKLRNSSLLTFIHELLQKDQCILEAFRDSILSAIADLIESSEEVTHLLLILCEKLQMCPLSSIVLDGTSEGKLSKIHGFLREGVRHWIRVVEDIIHGDTTPIDAAKLAVLWGIINCYPHVLNVEGNSSLLLDFVATLDQLLMIESENFAGIPRQTWQSLLGAALNSYYKCHVSKKTEHGETSKVLGLAKAYKSSSQVLFAVADYLDNMHGPAMEADKSTRVYHPEFKAAKAVDAVGIFSENLCHPDEGIRLATLRILCQYEPLNCATYIEDQPLAKKMKTEDSQASLDGSDVLQLLLSIEATPLSILTSRKVILSISRIQMDLSAGRISETYLPLVLNGIIGIFHNKFSYLWDPASECLAVLISKHVGLVWDKFVQYLGQCQAIFQTSYDQIDSANANFSEKGNDLVERFNLFVTPPSDGTSNATIFSLLLQSLQRVPFIAESRSRSVIPLFLKFLGYDGDDLVSVGVFNSHACKGQDWKGILKEWLNLLKLMRNPKSFYQSHFLKDVLQNRLLDDNDAEIQMKVLDCLLMWKDDFLISYERHLKNLISSKDLREELTKWSLSRECSQVDDSHRARLLPLVIRLLMPKVRKLKTLASRKNASMHHRKAVLGFIAQVDVDELPLFFALLIKPLHITPKGVVDLFWISPTSSTMDEFQALNFLEYFTVENIAALSWKKRYSFLHVIQHILEVFDELHIRPFLDLLMGCVVRVLLSCTLNLEAAKDAASSLLENHSTVDMISCGKHNAMVDEVLTSAGVKQFKELRSSCLKIVSFVLDKYEDHHFGQEFWDLFFTSVKPLIEGFKQEGASSEKPSSLFSCFLAMSRSHELVQLLCREKNLVPDIFSMLMVKTASEAIKCSVLKFIQNLLSLDSELDDEGSAVKSVLLPNLEALICSLHSLFQGDSASKRRPNKYPGETEAGIFRLLSKYIKNPSHATKFVDILLPLLAKRAKDSDARFEVLQVIRDIVPVLGTGSMTKILNAISPLLVIAERDLRLCICDLLDALAKTDSSLLFLAKLIRELNATSTRELGDLDDGTVVNAYEKIDVDSFNTLREDHTLVILSHCMNDMSSEELILRHSAYRLLLSFVEFSALITGQEVRGDNKSPEAMITVDGFNWNRACIERIISKLLLKHISDAMSHGRSVKKEWIDLLREMVLKLPDVANLNSFRALCSEDAEIDFFNNIIHLQKHRRARAMLRFKNLISNSNLPEGTVTNIFVHLFFNMLLDVQDGKDEHVRTACVEALASIAAHMEWKSYYALLTRCFRQMSIKASKQKVLVRLICSILDQFHFSEVGFNREHEDSTDNLIGAGTITEMRTCLHKTVLPKIQKLMNSDADSLNVNISLAALKVLKLLPGEIMVCQLPTIIYRICNFLKSRLGSIRDEARMALAACLKELGPKHLHSILGALRGTLKRGYELHVLGYTLNFILSKYLSDPFCGKLDDCLEDLLLVVKNDILGDVAEEKEVEKIAAKMKETRKCTSFESLKLIGQSVTLKSHTLKLNGQSITLESQVLKLLSPLTTALQKHLTPKMKTKLESMLDHIAAGIECNPSVDQTDLLIFVYARIEDGISEEKGVGESLFTSDINKGQRTDVPRSPLITVFALTVLHNQVKKMKLDRNDDQLLSKLDPFVKLLGDCLNSKYENILSSSLRCLTLLVRLPLPSLDDLADKIKAKLFDIAQSMVTSGSPLMQTCLKLLTVLLRSTKITVSSDQLQLLIQFPLFVDLERNPSFIALSLLKAIVNRKLVVHEIYDLVIRVAELMVTSQVESIRKKCSQILLQFLLDYHLSEKRLQQHLDFLLANLRYEHSSGREAVLEMLHAIVIKFPKSVVDEQSQTLFVHLVICLANDHDNKVRSMTGAVIKLLIGRVSPHPLNSILEYSLSWYLGGKEQLWSAAAQVLGLLIQVMKKSFQKHNNSVLPVIRNILESAVKVDADQQQDKSGESNIPFWKEAYYSLVLLEKLLYQFNYLSLESDLEAIWTSICQLLLHPHAWLRNISSRLVALYFTTVTEATRENPENQFGDFLLMSPSRLFTIAVSIYCQIKAQLTDDDDASNLLTQNLVFAISGLHSLMRQSESGDPHKFWSTLEQHEQAQFVRAFQLLDPKRGKGMFFSLISGAHALSDQGQFEDIRNLLVSNLLKRMGKLALEMEAIQMKIVFNSFRKLSLEISQNDCHCYAFQMLLPLYKVTEGFAGKVISDDMKQLAQDVRESIRNAIGIQSFVQIYSEIRKNMKAKRDKRKQEEKLMAVVNPTRNAKRKLRIAAKHRANKKRKMMTIKMARWMR